MHEWPVRIPSEYEAALLRAGLTANADEDSVQDALLGILIGSQALTQGLTDDEDIVEEWSRTTVHVGRATRERWWATEPALRRAATEFANSSDARELDDVLRFEPALPERLGFSLPLVTACIDCLEAPMSMQEAEDGLYVTPNQDARWDERDWEPDPDGFVHLSDRLVDPRSGMELGEEARRWNLIALLHGLDNQDYSIMGLYLGLFGDESGIDAIREHFELSREAARRRLRVAIENAASAMSAGGWAPTDFADGPAEDPRADRLRGSSQVPRLVPEAIMAMERCIEILWVVGRPVRVGHLSLIADLTDPASRIIESAREDDRLRVDRESRLFLQDGRKSPVPAAWAWTPPPGERRRQVEVAVRVLQERGSPMPFDELAAAVSQHVSTRRLRNAITSSSVINRADRADFGLSEWPHEPYESIEGLIRRHIARSGGEATVEAIVTDLTSRFTVKEASIRAFAKTDAFVPTGPGTIRNREDGEEVEEKDQPISALRDCSIRDGRWSIRVRVDAPLIRGFSRVVPAGFAHHLGVQRRASVRLPTALGLPITVVRKGMNNHIGRLRPIAESLGLTEGDVLVVLAPGAEQETISFEAITRQRLVDVDTEERIGLLLGIERPIATSDLATALDMPATSTVAALAASIRIRGEAALADDVEAVLASADRAGPATHDIAGLLGL